MTKNRRPLRILYYSMLLFCAVQLLVSNSFSAQSVANTTPTTPPELVLAITISGSINPATDDYLKKALATAKERKASLLLVKLNTPGGLLTSTQTMIETMLESSVPVVVYITPRGGSATSAGVFITMAGHIAAMSPGTTIGAAHPVQGGGEDVAEDMRAKIENFAASMAKAVAEQRGRNAAWAEKAVRESVSITDREAVKEKVVDFVAEDIDDLFKKLEGRTIKLADGSSTTFTDLKAVQLEDVAMTLRQQVVNILSDPSIAVLIGLAAMLGLGIEFYNPGLIFPGVFGAICLVLSLTATQVLPINYGGLVLLILAVVFFVVEVSMPSFGIWGFAGIVCLVLGSIYVIDTNQVWSAEEYAVDIVSIGIFAAAIGILLFTMSFLLVRDRSRKVATGREGLVGQKAKVRTAFNEAPDGMSYQGKVHAMGEIWRAEMRTMGEPPRAGEELEIVSFEEGLKLVVKRSGNV